MKRSSKRSPSSEAKKENVHFFDLDRTLFVKNVSFAFYFYLLKRGIVPFFSLVKTIPLYLKKPPLAEIHHQVFKHVLYGLPFSELNKCAEIFLKEITPKLLCPKIFSYLERAKKMQEKVFLLSSSPLYLVEKIAREFGFDQWIGTEYGVDKEGRICQITSLITGFEKREMASHWAGRGDGTIAYSDSRDDVPLLEWADKAIVIRPSRKFRKLARARNWTLI